MSPLSEPAAPHGHVALRTRLQAYARYAELVAQQLAALDEGDLARVQQLTAERERVHHVLGEATGAASDGGPDDTAELRVEFPELLAEALRALEGRTAAEQVLRDRLSDLEGVTLRTLRGAELRRARRGQYWRSDASQHRLDVRF